MNSTEPRTTPRWILWTSLVLFSGVLMFISAEVVLRIVPGQWSGAFFYVYDPEVGTWHLPNFVGDNVSVDYAIRNIHFNSFGMRDAARTLQKKPGVIRIAVLGDSFTEGIQVADDQIYTRRMESLLGGKVEVLNFGVGGFGTTQEYETYMTKVRPFKPDIVILAFLSSNDMRNNSIELESLYNGGGYREMPFPTLNATGTWSVAPVPAKPLATNPIILFLKRHFVLYRFLWFEFGKYSALLEHPPAVATSTPQTTAENPNVYLTRLDAPPAGEPVPFQRAWAGTDWIIGQLQKAVQADDAQFILVALPDAAHVEPSPRAALEKDYGAPLPKEFDIDYPEKHLAALAQNRFPYLDLTPTFRAYRDEHHLVSPYFSHLHDGHWAAIGHQLAAETIVTYLRDHHFVP